MYKILHAITDYVSTRKGSWLVLGIWVIAVVVLTMAAPSARDYQLSGIDTLPEEASSVIASEKVTSHFESSDSLPAILVFEGDSEVSLDSLIKIVEGLTAEEIAGLEEIVPLGKLPPQATEGFFSEDQTTAIIPVNLESGLETEEIKSILEEIYNVVEENTDFILHITGPAGIAVDTTDLFLRADLVLIFATVGIILVLLVVIYRSPLIALIPLLAAVFVYQVVMQILGILGSSGLDFSTQTVSIMTILLFAAVIDYSLFVFSRYKEELKVYQDKHEAMKVAMRGTGLPVFYSGGTVLVAMLILIFAQLGDYKNFAPIFGTALAVIMLSSVTLVPALFTLFGRKSFWPIIPKVGENRVKSNSFWSRVGRFVTTKPIIAVVSIGVFLIISSINVQNIQYEFNLLKSFPEDMPSRVGYEVLEDKFNAGDLAPTTVLFESDSEITEDNQAELMDVLMDQPLVNNVRIDGMTEDRKAISYSMTFEINPYDTETLDALESIQDNKGDIIEDSNVDGELYFAGETASSVDDRSYNNRDLIVIVILETILIFIMLIFLTKSVKMPIYMMGTILVSFIAALGLGTFLMILFFDIETVSNRVPVYAFIFLVALGIDYNIILVSRFQEERKHHSVKKAVEIAVAHTGGVISSAGIILASTFAVLMTQPVQLLFVFGFIVAVGILIDTFLVRGVLLPGLLVLFEKDKQGDRLKDE
ncbi:MMPL family transporter [Oceanobacillus piezotolerans]|uniref:MMPL family transporter n=1 Tax=Oceanobacillus piezotolerans TaxID=2448030 RepID=A0A498D2U3_9BACI|nr:MMPL family transporter [Oceanobacillus piezotolerans]RLL42003.1 MMPL family transporter [Oceanobacillus piezotolerans]